MNIEAAKEKHLARLLRLPNVTGVGIGEEGGQKVIKVYVTHKVPSSELGEGLVPPRLEGYRCDVEELGVVRAGLEGGGGA